MNRPIASIDVGRAALRMALTATREEEDRLKEQLREQGFRAAAVDFGGEFLPSIKKSWNGRWWQPSGRTSSPIPMWEPAPWPARPMKPWNR